MGLQALWICAIFNPVNDTIKAVNNAVKFVSLTYSSLKKIVVTSKMLSLYSFLGVPLYVNCRN